MLRIGQSARPHQGRGHSYRVPVAVTVRFFAAARAAAGTSEDTASPGTLDSVARELTERHRELETVLPRCSFLVDGTAVHGEPADIEILEGSQIDVLPPFAGG